MDDDRRHSRQHEWRKHGPKRARLQAVLEEIQVAAESAANQQAQAIQQVPEYESSDEPDEQLEVNLVETGSVDCSCAEDQNPTAIQEGKLPDDEAHQVEISLVHPGSNTDPSFAHEQCGVAELEQMQERETVVQAPGEEVDLVQEANAGSNVDSSSAHEHVAAIHKGKEAQRTPGDEDNQLEVNLVNSESDVAQQEHDNSDGFDSDGSSICDMEMHFLEEELEQNGDCSDQDDPPSDPDDPDDPHVSDASGEESDNSDLENEEMENFDFSDAALNEPVLMRTIPTVREMLLLDLALMMRHKQTYESLIDSFDCKNIAFGKKFFPTSKKELWRVLGYNKAGIVEHVYCSLCGGYIGKKSRQGMYSICPNVRCDFRIETSKAKFFVTLSLRSQLKKFLETPGVADLLKYRDTRVKHKDGAIEDVYDSQGYKDLKLGPNDFSGNLNTDGCKIRKGAKLEIYPVFLRLNELPPLLRQKFMFLAAVYVDVREPKMNCLLQPVVTQLNSLNETGVTWSPNGTDHVVSKVKVHCFCVDGKARHQILNMSTHQSHFGCTYCTIRGVTVGDTNTMRWPHLPHDDIPAFEDRSHEVMIQSMLQAHEDSTPVLGHKGVTSLMLVNDLDLRRSNACDDLHILYECAAKHITELCITEAPRVNASMGQDALCRLIDNRMKKIKTPSNISRKPGNCSFMNRKQMKGSEWRNWILYYAVPCLKGLIVDEYITPVAYLSRGAFLYSQDIILPEHIVEADYCFDRFLELNERLYGIERTKLNLHALIHFAKCVRELGNLWCYTTFNFESWNHIIIQFVSSPNGALLQIVVRHLILLSLELAQHAEENISPAIRAQLSKILRKKRMTRAQQFSAHVYGKGMATVRNATVQEQQALQAHGFQDVQILREFKKMSINSTDYYPWKYFKDDWKSDNSLVYTFSDTFCTIQSVVQFHVGDRDVCGLFVLEHSVTNRPHFPLASHITCLLEPENDLPFFLFPQDIRCPVVKMPLLGERYVVPLPNLFEID